VRVIVAACFISVVRIGVGGICVLGIGVGGFGRGVGPGIRLSRVGLRVALRARERTDRVAPGFTLSVVLVASVLTAFPCALPATADRAPTASKPAAAATTMIHRGMKITLPVFKNSLL